MAGLGYKTFNAGDVLTAAQVQGYLQEKAVFMEISHHGWVESTPHAITRVH